MKITIETTVYEPEHSSKFVLKFLTMILKSAQPLNFLLMLLAQWGIRKQENI